MTTDERSQISGCSREETAGVFTAAGEQKLCTHGLSGIHTCRIRTFACQVSVGGMEVERTGYGRTARLRELVII